MGSNGDYEKKAKYLSQIKEYKKKIYNKKDAAFR